MQIITEKFYGRLKSRALTETQKTLFSTLLPDIKISNFNEIDCSKYRRIFLEIGFGGGEHMAQLAIQNPEDLFLGCEPFVNGVAASLCKISDHNITNIRIFPDDARKFIPSITEESIDGVFLMFPDPWPKRRHVERRFVNKINLERLHKILKTDGFWKIATDHVEYAKHTLKTFQQFEHLYAKVEEYDETNRPSELEWPHTRYEQKSTSSSFLYVVYHKINKGNLP